MRTLTFLILFLLAASAGAGQAHLTWKNADGIAASEVAVGSCVDGAYGVDLFSGEYARIPPDRDDALILQLKEGDSFCFRVRHISDDGVPSSWLFIGPVLIPEGPAVGPPVVVPPTPPPPPTDGGVLP